LLALLERRIDERAAEHQRIAADLSGAQGIRALLWAEAMDLAANQEWARLLVEFRTVAARDPALNRRYTKAHARTVQGLAHAVTYSPFHRRRLAGVELDRLEPADLSSLR
jgi:hypothetical protein